MKQLFFLLYFYLVINYARCAMSEAQLESTARLIRNVCQPKAKVSNDQIDAVHRGEFTEDTNMMCYMECILRSAHIMKDAKPNMDSIKAQIATLPPRYTDTATGGVEKCKDEVKSDEKCSAAYEFYKCLYEFNPENFFLP